LKQSWGRTWNFLDAESDTRTGVKKAEEKFRGLKRGLRETNRDVHCVVGVGGVEGEHHAVEAA